LHHFIIDQTADNSQNNHLYISDKVIFLNELFSYRNQFEMLAENLSQERKELEIRESAQGKVSRIMK